MVPDASAVVLEYHLEEPVRLDRPALYSQVERWTVSVLAVPAAGEARVQIGYANLLIFNLAPGADIGDLTDPVSGTWLSGHDGVARPERHVLLLDRLWLSPDWRGQGLGPVVAAAAIERLGRGCDLAACYPAPFEDLDPQPDVRQRAVEVLGRIWSKVGFTEWNDGVWMIDLSTDDVHAALVALIDARTVAS